MGIPPPSKDDSSSRPKPAIRIAAKLSSRKRKSFGRLIPQKIRINAKPSDPCAYEDQSSRNRPNSPPIPFVPPASARAATYPTHLLHPGDALKAQPASILWRAQPPSRNLHRRSLHSLPHAITVELERCRSRATRSANQNYIFQALTTTL